MKLLVGGAAVGLVLAMTIPGSGQALSIEADSPDLILRVEARPGEVVVIEKSSDLVRWTPSQVFLMYLPAEALRVAPVERAAFFRMGGSAVAPPDSLVWIRPGEFLMGSPSQERDRKPDEGPQRVVTLRRGFWMARWETTVREYVDYMGDNPSTAPPDSTRPIESITFDEAMEYCSRRTARERRLGLIPPGVAYHLPTEAEWEYAARAGTTTRFSFGDDLEDKDFVPFAWGGLNANGVTHPVGEKLPNPWGLYDIHGNVFELCLDYYWAYPGGVASQAVKAHVYRGGSWYCAPSYLRSASRHPSGESRATMIGFRVVLAAEPDTVNPPPPQAETPVLTLVWSEDRTTVTIVGTTTTPDAVVRYAFYGAVPYGGSPADAPMLYEAGKIKATAFVSGWFQSEPATVVIERLDSPTYSREGNLLTLIPPVEGAGIEWSWGEGEWRTYTGPIQLPARTAVVRTRSTMPGFLTSPEVFFDF